MERAGWRDEVVEQKSRWLRMPLVPFLFTGRDSIYVNVFVDDRDLMKWATTPFHSVRFKIRAVCARQFFVLPYSLAVVWRDIFTDVGKMYSRCR